MSKHYFVITLLSNDQPGVVQQLADVISQHNGNWLESRMAQLAGKFAGILKVSIAPEQAGALTASLQQLCQSGIQLNIEDTSELSPLQGKTLAFELAGADRVGIISEISQAFAEKGISIDEMETYFSSMPWSGDPLFEAVGALIAPTAMDTKDLLDKLDEIEDSLGVDIKLTEQL